MWTSASTLPTPPWPVTSARGPRRTEHSATSVEVSPRPLLVPAVGKPNVWHQVPIASSAIQEEMSQVLRSLFYFLYFFMSTDSFIRMICPSPNCIKQEKVLHIYIHMDKSGCLCMCMYLYHGHSHAHIHDICVHTINIHMSYTYICMNTEPSLTTIGKYQKSFKEKRGGSSMMASHLCSLLFLYKL